MRALTGLVFAVAATAAVAAATQGTIQSGTLGAGRPLIEALASMPGAAGQRAKVKLKEAGIDLEQLAQGTLKLTPPQLVEAQRLVNEALKPVPIIKGKLTPKLGQPNVPGYHRNLTADEKKVIEQASRSIGRIEVRYGDSVVALGTGFVIAGDTIATNCHVVDALEKVRTEVADKGPVAVIDFGEGDEQDRSLEYPLTDVLGKPQTLGLDVAVLRVVPPKGKVVPPALPVFAGAVSATEKSPMLIGLIGFPSFGSASGPYKELVDKGVTSGRIYSPGAIVDVQDTYGFNSLFHVANTLPGNSGSPVFRLDKQQVVGVHACCSQGGAVAVPATASQCARFAQNGLYRNVAISVEAAAGNAELKTFFIGPGGGI